MRRFAFMASIGLITTCLAGWVALHAQTPGGAWNMGRSNSGRPGGNSPQEAPILELVPSREANRLPMVPTPPSNAPRSDYTSYPRNVPSLPSTPMVVDTQKKSAPVPTNPVPPQNPPIPGPVLTDYTAEPGTLGRSDTGVSLEWTGKGSSRTGVPMEYMLTVRNTSITPAHEAVVKVRIPPGVRLQGSEPAAREQDGLYSWSLGTMEVRQEQRIKLTMVAERAGEIQPQAWISCMGTSSARIRVREPKLLVRCQAPERFVSGEKVALNLEVSNPGDGPVELVRVKATLPPALEPAPGTRLDMEVGPLLAGESRRVTLACVTRGQGQHSVEVVASAEGGLLSKEVVPVTLTAPRIAVEMTGPRLRYVDRRAIYRIKVANSGDATATNTMLVTQLPPGFKVLAATDSGQHDVQSRRVFWNLQELPPGKVREVKFETQAVDSGDFRHLVHVETAQGQRSECELSTRVENHASLLVEVVDTDDPVEVGGVTIYEVRVTNIGSKTESGIKLVADLPERMRLVKAESPSTYQESGQRVVFESTAPVAPRGEILYRMHVKALEAGTAMLKVQVTSANLLEPIVKTESTRIYSDMEDPQKVSESRRTAEKPIAPANLPADNTLKSKPTPAPTWEEATRPAAAPAAPQPVGDGPRVPIPAPPTLKIIRHEGENSQALPRSLPVMPGADPSQP